MWDLTLDLAALAARTCLGLVFVTAALQKLRHLSMLEGVVANYRLLPPELSRWVARLLPWAEFGVGGWLLSGLAPSSSAAAGSLLLLAFAAAMAVNLRRGRTDIDCGCGGSILRQRLSWALVGRNLALALAASMSFGAEGHPQSVATAVVAMVGGCGLYILYVLFNTITSLASHDFSAA